MQISPHTEGGKAGHSAEAGKEHEDPSFDGFRRNGYLAYPLVAGRWCLGIVLKTQKREMWFQDLEGRERLFRGAANHSRRARISILQAHTYSNVQDSWRALLKIYRRLGRLTTMDMRSEPNSQWDLSNGRGWNTDMAQEASRVYDKPRLGNWTTELAAPNRGEAA